MKVHWPLFFVFASVLITSQVFAQEFYAGAHSLGLAGSGSAGLEAPEAAFLNPALVGLLRSGAQLTYLDGSPGRTAHETNMGISLTDAEAGNLSPGVLSYRHLRQSGQGLAAPATGELWHGALGKRIAPHFVLGVSVSFLKYRISGNSVPDQWQGSVGTLFPLTSDFGVSYVWKSLGLPGSQVPQALREELTQTVGVYYKTGGMVRLRADLSRQERENPDHQMDVAASFEVKTSDYFLFRLGHEWEGMTGKNHLGAGLSFEGPRLKLDYGFRQNLKDSESMHGVDLRIPF